MNRAVGGRNRGYTIIETLIFLAVSGFMFLITIGFINGRQARSEFTTGAREFEAVINDIANDVSNGYFSNVAGSEFLQCSPTAAGVSLTTSTTNSQGTNAGCIFLGKAIQLAPKYVANDKMSSYVTIPLVGRQYDGISVASGYAKNYAQTTVNAASIAREEAVITGRPTIACAFYLDAAADTPNASAPCTTAGTRSALITFMTALQTSTGSSQVSMLVSTNNFQTNTNLNTTQNRLKGYSNTSKTVSNPAGGVYICLQSNGSDQYGLLKLGGQGSRFSTSLTIDQGSCT